MAPPVAENVLVALICVTVAIIYSGKTEFALQKISEIIHRKPGCNPIPSVGNVTLHYFAGRGRGEAIRMLMANAEVPWSETRFTKESWPGAKEAGVSSGIYTFGQGTSKQLIMKHPFLYPSDCTMFLRPFNSNRIPFLFVVEF